MKKYDNGGSVDDKKEYSPGDPDSSPELDDKAKKEKKDLEDSIEKKLRDTGNKKLKPISSDKQASLGKLPPKVRNKMGYMKCGGKVHKMKKGGMVGKCKRDGIAVRGKTRAGR